MPRTRKLRRTSPEVSVLKFTELYGLSVVEAVARLPALKGHSELEVKRLIDRLLKQKLMAETWLYSGRRCYCVTATGIEAIGSTDMCRQSNDRPMSEESKIRRFAMLSFCCLGQITRMKLSPAFLQETFPTLNARSVTAGYYLKLTREKVIGFLRVDMGGEGRWDRVIAKCIEDARRIATSPIWRQHAAVEQFEVTVVTALSQKAERLSRAFQEIPSPIPIRIAVIPELLNLIAPPPH